MKVTCRDKEITSYIKSIEIEVEGETYLADLTYDCHGGYTLQFVSDEGKLIDWPEWADKYDNGQRSLDYDLDEMSGNWEYARDIMKESV